jgi:hypothetical protein
MGKCALCDLPNEPHRKLCEVCNTDRLRAASGARIFAGNGLTWSNAEEYSEDNWIRTRARVALPKE